MCSIPYTKPVYTRWFIVHWNATGKPLVDPVYTETPLGDPMNTCRVHWSITGKTQLKMPHTGMPLAKLWQFWPTLEKHWKKSWNCPTLGCHRRNFCSLHWHTTAGTVIAQHTQAHKVKHGSNDKMPGSNDKMAGHQFASGQVSVNPAFTWCLLFCNGYQFCS